MVFPNLKLEINLANYHVIICVHFQLYYIACFFVFLSFSMVASAAMRGLLGLWELANDEHISTMS